LIVPPITDSPACFTTGRLSPVTIDSSTVLLPLSTSPSTGMRSPGLTMTRSCSTSAAIGTSISCSSRRTRAWSGRSPASARRAAAVCRFARASKVLPTSTSEMMNSTASKYTSGDTPLARKNPGAIVAAAE